MEYVVAVFLIIVSVCLLFDKSLKIEITHRYPQQPELKPSITQEKLDEAQVSTMNSVVQTLQSFMGVESHGDSDDNRPA